VDDKAVRWACPLRVHLAQRTQTPYYLRPGDFWFRNPEFGKYVSDGRKRGRFGKKENITLPKEERNPYPIGEMYHPYFRKDI